MRKDCQSSEMKRYLVQHAPKSTLDWSKAAPLTDFTFAWEQRPAPWTEFRALHDGESFWFRFECEDADLVLPEADTAKDRALGSDRVEIFFAPDLSLKPYFALEMSPRGDVADYAARFYREIDWDWCCEGLRLDTQIMGSRYTVSGSIPLEVLRRLGVLRGSEMYAGLYRAEFHHREDGSVHMGWMPWVNPGTAKPDFHVPESFGVLELVAC